MSLYSHDLIVCPHCGGESGHRVDRLYSGAPRAFGPWYCGQCRGSFSGRVKAPKDVDVWQNHDGARFTRSMALLKLEADSRTVFFVMDHDRYWPPDDLGQSDRENQSHQRYYFEEHSCPTNWLSECVAVIEDGDTDPHGFLEFVRAVNVPNDFDEDDDSVWRALFPEAFPTGTDR